MSRRSTKQRRAARRRREACEAWRGWQLMTSGSIGARIRQMAALFQGWPFTNGGAK